MPTTKKPLISESIICDALNSKYQNGCKYKLANGYIFKSDWESDYFIQKLNGYCYEFEIKISRADFLNDKKKINKHLILEKGAFVCESKHYKLNAETKKLEIKEIIKKDIIHNFKPNKFFYVVPTNMIDVKEIPSYAGLMYYDVERKTIKTIKEAPFIHKTKLKFESTLCVKFYNYWLNAKFKIKELGWEIEDLKKEIDTLKKKK
jgi:hypothetical protein